MVVLESRRQRVALLSSIVEQSMSGGVGFVPSLPVTVGETVLLLADVKGAPSEDLVFAWTREGVLLAEGHAPVLNYTIQPEDAALPSESIFLQCSVTHALGHATVQFIFDVHPPVVSVPTTLSPSEAPVPTPSISSGVPLKIALGAGIAGGAVVMGMAMLACVRARRQRRVIGLKLSGPSDSHTSSDRPATALGDSVLVDSPVSRVLPSRRLLSPSGSSGPSSAPQLSPATGVGLHRLPHSSSF